MFRTDLAFFRRALRAPARVTGRAGLAVLLVGATVAVLEVPTSVSAAAATISIVDGNGTTTPSTLANILIGPNATLFAPALINGSAAFSGASDPRLKSYGTFSNGTNDVGIDSGLIIAANADAHSFALAATVQRVGLDRQDPALAALLATQPGFCTGSPCTHNATDLSFSIVPSGDFIKFEYSLVVSETGTWNGSAWQGYVTSFPDGFGLFVNGESPASNCATVPSSGAYLTMKTAGIVAPTGSAAANRAAALATVAPGQKFAYATENTGWSVKFLTVPLTCVVDVSAANTSQTPVSVRIVIADANDTVNPPAVLLKAGSIRFEPTAAPQISPAWTDQMLGTIQINVPYADGVSASGDPAVTYSISAGELPTGLSLDTATGAITGTAAAAGAYDFTITVANGNLPDLVKQFTGNVAVPPAWTDSTIDAAFQLGVAVDDGVTASGTPAPTYSVSAGGLPAGLSLNTTTGAITGNPTTSAAYSFTVSASNGIGSAVTQAFTGTVSISPEWIDQTLGAIQLNALYTDGVSASSSPAPTYSISAGFLVAGLSMSTATGAITGTPTAAGAYNFTITVANGSLPNLVKQFTGNVNVPPMWTDQTLGTIQVGKPYDDGVSVSAEPAPTYSISAGMLPAGLSLDTAIGAITGIPTTAGAYDFTITVANGSQPDLVEQFTGTVVESPTWTDSTITAALQLDVAVDDGVSATGTPAPTYSISAGSLPAGLALDTTTGAITGTPTVGGTYSFTLSAGNGIGTAATKVFGGTVAQPAGGFMAINPVRLLDTRDAGDSLIGHMVRHLVIAGLTGIPADASSVVLNVTATNAVGSGFITVFACDTTMPQTSNLNFLGNQTVASSVSVSLDASGGVCIFSDVDTDVIVDISGAYSLGEGIGRLAAVQPYRIADTREDGARLAAGTSYVLNVDGHGMPDDATAVLFNITVDNPGSAGFVTAYPCGGEVPLASNLNFLAGQTIANSAVVKIGTNHTVCFYVSQDTDLVIDVNGSYSPSSAVGFPTNAHQQRLLDTRETGSAAARSVQEVDLNNVVSVPANATSVTLNVTVDGPEEPGFITVYPCSSGRPLASNLNFVAGQTVANSVTVPVGANHTVCVFTTAATDLVIDLNEVYSTVS